MTNNATASAPRLTEPMRAALVALVTLAVLVITLALPGLVTPAAAAAPIVVPVADVQPDPNHDTLCETSAECQAVYGITLASDPAPSVEADATPYGSSITAPLAPVGAETTGVCRIDGDTDDAPPHGPAYVSTCAPLYGPEETVLAANGIGEDGSALYVTSEGERRWLLDAETGTFRRYSDGTAYAGPDAS